MALYRNVAGADALGITNDYYFTRSDIYDGGGGGGGEVSPQPALTTDPIAIEPLLPIRSIDPVEMQITPQVFYDPWYVPSVPPTIAPDPVVQPLPPDYVTQTPTGGTIDPTPAIFTSGRPILPREEITYSTVTPYPEMTDRVPEIQTTALPLQPNTAEALQANLWPLLVLAGVLVVAVKGEDLLQKNRHVAFIGGVAALYYLMKKPIPTVTTD